MPATAVRRTASSCLPHGARSAACTVIQQALSDASRPYRRMASIFWISTILAQRPQRTLSKCLGIWSSRRARPDAREPGSTPSSRGSSRRDCQYSAGRFIVQSQSAPGRAFLPAPAALFLCAFGSACASWRSDRTCLYRTYQEQLSRTRYSRVIVRCFADVRSAALVWFGIGCTRFDNLLRAQRLR